MKYRIVQKGDKFSAQYKWGWLQKRYHYSNNNAGGFGWRTMGFWGTKEDACEVIRHWRERRKNIKELAHKPEDLCGECPPKKRIRRVSARLGGAPVTSLGGVKPITNTPRPAGQPQGQQPK